MEAKLSRWMFTVEQYRAGKSGRIRHTPFNSPSRRSNPSGGRPKRDLRLSGTIACLLAPGVQYAHVLAHGSFAGGSLPVQTTFLFLVQQSEPLMWIGCRMIPL